MTLFFDLQVLEEDTLRNPKYMVIALDKYYRKQFMPKNAKELYKPLRRMKPGSSFLLNPSPLFLDKSVDDVFKAQYIRLAGRRDYTLYKSFGIKALDLTMFPDVDLNSIKHNPLLTIANKTISFKYEEQHNGNQLQ